MSGSSWEVYDQGGNVIYYGSLYDCERLVYKKTQEGMGEGLYVSNNGPVHSACTEKSLPRLPKDAPGLLKEAAELIDQRAAERDVEKERSMATAVKLFAEISGKALSEYEGWLFMVCLKLARNRAGSMTFNRDHLLDAMAYLALALESRNAGG